ncbi:hypothetical protein LTR08_002348 [Meristemomyces frigidus]|nr:hypothetical protein LTR08_002348 [Meristemomyces frigidus]
MAFNFNWSPLIADTDRVREMLTASLNKSPKPPIIVDDILVNELNLGSTPPSLEILEIGDLAEDRFRGIFKMSYTGDAYLTLKTRVQANPLNTFLSTKPGFASPRPLAAGSGLTIPLQITLSDIRLSGFVILVFSKQKGITLVFRNDPLESLKVSSTFDSIPFVRDYLQKTIESQLRVLFMEDLPAIIHRLSLRMFSPEHQAAEERQANKDAADDHSVPIDPFANPAQQAVDSAGMPLDGSAPFTLDAPTETYASFSQKNLLRLATLTESQRTLSPFTPSLRDTVYRAWASAAERDFSNVPTPLSSSNGNRPPTLSRLESTLASQGGGGWSSAASQTSDYAASAASGRPSLASFASAPTVYSMSSGAPGRSRTGKKRRNRVVNLRKDKGDGGGEGKDVSDAASASSCSGYMTGESVAASRSIASGSAGNEGGSVPATPLNGVEVWPAVAREGEITTPPHSPPKVRFRQAEADSARLGARDATIRGRPATPLLSRRHSHHPPHPHRDRQQHYQGHEDTSNDDTPRASMFLPAKAEAEEQELPRRPPPRRPQLAHMQTLPSRPAPAAADDGEARYLRVEGTGGILEQAWMMKMAKEIEGRVGEAKGWRRRGGEGEGEEGGEAPPAYVS